MSLFKETLEAIAPVDRSIREDVSRRLDNLTKPKGSLGMLEDLVVQYCLSRGSQRADIQKPTIFTFAGDHGVVAEGVSAFPSTVTAQMLGVMLEGRAAVNVLARHAGVQVRLVDVGVKGSVETACGLISCKIKAGT